MHSSTQASAPSLSLAADQDTSAQVASGGPGKLNLEQMLREVHTSRGPQLPSTRPYDLGQLLDELFVDDRWRHLAPHLHNAARDELTLAWHRLPGWPDSSAGLYAIKKHAIIATLSSGSTRALADMVRPPVCVRPDSGNARHRPSTRTSHGTSSSPLSLSALTNRTSPPR